MIGYVAQQGMVHVKFPAGRENQNEVTSKSYDRFESLHDALHLCHFIFPLFLYKIREEILND